MNLLLSFPIIAIMGNDSNKFISHYDYTYIMRNDFIPLMKFIY